jgi:hypothetical protein
VATVAELADRALARCAEFGVAYPATRSLLYIRLGVRQQELYSAAARTNPEYFGATALGILDVNGEISLSTLGDPAAVDPVPNMELISRLEVAASSGAGAPAVGSEINVVPVTDPDAALAPRVTVRGGTIAPVGTDLALVSRILVFYSHRPFLLRPEDAAVVIEMPEPFHDLLVLDLALYLLRKTASLPKEERQVALAALGAEEKEGIANFLAHVKEFTSAVERGRFGRTQGSTKQ